MRTLAQIEPRTPISSLPFQITNSGAFYLTKSLTGTNGIFVGTNDVDIDLNGFALIGPSNNAVGIDCSVRTNIAIRNGTLRNWKDAALMGVQTANLRVESLQLSDNNISISVGRGALVLNCMVSRNSYGIHADEGSLIENCVAKENSDSDAGIYMGGGSVLNCTVEGNSGLGIFGIRTLVKNCSVSGNGSAGIFINGEGSILDCRIAQNVGPGIQCQSQQGEQACQEPARVKFSGYGNQKFTYTSKACLLGARFMDYCSRDHFCLRNKSPRILEQAANLGTYLEP